MNTFNSKTMTLLLTIIETKPSARNTKLKNNFQVEFFFLTAQPLFFLRLPHSILKCEQRIFLCVFDAEIPESRESILEFQLV